MKDRCERCGSHPQVITKGPFAGEYGMFDYCEYCSQDLCDKCMKEGTCADSPNDKHKKADDEHDY